jgi:hypothetical protein
MIDAIFRPLNAPPKRSTRPIRVRRKPRRVSVNRNRAYLDWLQERACVACKILRDEATRWEKLLPPIPVLSDPAHGPVNGMRSKGPDNEAIPLCRAHHNEQHAITWPAFEEKYGFSRKKEAKVHYAAYLIWRESQAV